MTDSTAVQETAGTAWPGRPPPPSYRPLRAGRIWRRLGPWPWIGPAIP